MKRYLTINNVLFSLAVGYLLFSSIPLLINNFSKEGQIIASQEVQVIEKVISDKKIVFPDTGRSMAIFWATWCAPCKLEMNRLAESVRSGNIPENKIIAINPFESTETIRTFLGKNSYPFIFIEDRGISEKLNISRTPTTLFIENSKVMSLSSGLSIVGIWRAEYFL